MLRNLNIEQKKSFQELLTKLSSALDITETQFDNLLRSYGAVGKYLEDDPQFAQYKPVISPQGSLRLGTMIQPISDEDDIDVDLVYRLTDKHSLWTQKNIKDKVGNRLKDNKFYERMLDEEGRRCWTLNYREDSDSPKEKYHMDVLPCVADADYHSRLERMMSSAYSHQEIDKLSIRITDLKATNYSYDSDIKNWLKSNPDGYALWFAYRCKQDSSVARLSFREIIPINKKGTKTTLQRIVQILKRHRDIMFKDDHEDKPISIIITTLAAKAYSGESNLLEGLTNVVFSMERYITRDIYGNYVISNPVNEEENFADKWPTHPKRKENFFNWIEKVKSDLSNIFSSTGIQLQNKVSATFGSRESNRAFNAITEKTKNDVKSGALKIGTTAMLGSVGSKVNASNSFYGKE